MQSIVYLNGTFLPQHEALIPINDRGFLFGDGIFTTVKILDGSVQCLSLHFKRLQDHCRLIGILPPDISNSVIQELISRNQAFAGAWRMKIIITGGDQSELSLKPRDYGRLLITLKPYVEPEVDSTYRLTVYPEPVERPSSKIKGLAYLDRLWIADYALKEKCEDALVCNADGFVLETAFANFFWRVKNQLMIPKKNLPLVDGVALQMVRFSAKALKMNIVDICATFSEIPQNAQVCVCNSLKGIIPVISIKEKTFNRDRKWEEQFKKVYQESIVLHSLF